MFPCVLERQSEDPTWASCLRNNGDCGKRAFCSRFLDLRGKGLDPSGLSHSVWEVWCGPRSEFALLGSQKISYSSSGPMKGRSAPTRGLWLAFLSGSQVLG